MQKTTLSHNTSTILKLKTTPKSQVYTTEISSTITQNNKTAFNNIAEEFTLTYIKSEEGFLVYRKEVKKRFFLNEINFVIKKLDKAQELALKMASINDILDFYVDKHFQIIKVLNTSQIREKWQILKNEILESYPDFDNLIADFDVQLEEKHIQQIFLEDNFLNLLFANLFHIEFKQKKEIEEEKLISNALGIIDIPIIEKRVLVKNKRLFRNVINIATNATIDTDSKKFSLAKINAFVGQLNTEKGSKHKLDFKYIGNYKIQPDTGLISEIELEHTFEIKDLYKKTSTYNLKLED